MAVKLTIEGDRAAATVAVYVVFHRDEFTKNPPEAVNDLLTIKVAQAVDGLRTCLQNEILRIYNEAKARLMEPADGANV
jgi:hypothetical protein